MTDKNKIATAAPAALDSRPTGPHPARPAAVLPAPAPKPRPHQTAS